MSKSEDRAGKTRALLAYGLAPALGLISGPVLSRSLNVGGRGEYAAIMQPITVAAAVASLGLPVAVAYYVARGDDPQRTYTTALKVGRGPIGLAYVAMVAYAFVVGHAQHISAPVLICSWLAVPAAALIQIRRGYWQGLGAWRRLDIERAVFALSRFFALLFLALIAVKTASIYSAGALAAFGFAAIILWAKPRPDDSGDTKRVPTTRGVRSYSTASAIGTISILANARLDQMLMPATSTRSDLGLYAVAVTVAEVPLILGVLASRNALNIAGRGAGVRQIFRETRFYLAVALLLSVLAFVVAPLLVPIVFGSAFSASNPAARILAVSIPFNVLTEVATSIFFGRGRPRLGSLIPLVGTTVTVVSFIAMWHEITPSTAAWIALASQGSAALFGCAALSVSRRNQQGTAPELPTRYE